MSIMGNMIGSYSQIGRTFILTDENGVELTGICTEKEQIFDATDNDVRQGSIYASDHGVSVGQKVIPAYHTCHGFRLITKGSVLSIPNQMPTIDSYDYTKLQGLICTFDTNPVGSVSTEKVIIEDNVYNVQSTEVVSTVIKNHDSKNVELGITNDTNGLLVLRYFMYKEIE